MAAEYSALTQTLNPGEALVFQNAPVPCNKGFVNHRDGSSIFLLSGLGNIPYRGCRCRGKRASAVYPVIFTGNISIPEGGTAGPISVAMALDGNALTESTMTVTPAAVNEEFNVGRTIGVAVWHGCCQTFSIRNTSAQAITIAQGNVYFGTPDLEVVA